jgi:protein TonB
MRKSKLLAGIFSIGIYILVVGLLVLYFNSKEYHKAKKYVKKNDNRIQVSLASKQVVSKKKSNIIKKTKKKLQHKTTHKSKKDISKRKKVNHQKKHKKNITKKPKHIKKLKYKKVVKKDINSTKTKKVNKKDLFANLKVSKKHNIFIVSDKPINTKPKNNFIKLTDKKVSALEKINNSLRKQKNINKGVTDRYLAKVQEMLEDWPAQSDFAGESVKVLLYIEPSGMFEFEIKSASRNPEFNQALVDYLKQLQLFGFGRHKGNRTYKFEANFVAKK